MNPPIAAWLLPLTVLALVILARVAWRAWAEYQHFKPLRGLPSPPGLPLLGPIPVLLASVREKRFFQLLFEWGQALGPVYVYWTGKPVLVLCKPGLIEDTIVQGMRSGHLIRSPGVRRAWNDLRGPILIGEEGQEWQWRRKAWNPEFTAGSITPHLPAIQQACARVLETIRATPPGEAVRLDPLFVDMSMRVIAQLVLGIPIDPAAVAPEGPGLDVAATHQAMAVLGYRFLRMATGEAAWMKYLPTRTARDYWAARHHLEELIAPRVRLALRLRDPTCREAESISPFFRESMLVRMALKEPRYDQESLSAETIEFLIAGTDTTAHTLSFAVGSLALHPEVCAGARAVVDQAWHRHGGLTAESLGGLGYVRGVIKETLRLFSVASGSSSLEAVRETHLEGIGTVPAGTRILWSMQAAGRDPEAYPDPLHFLPQRWLHAEKERPAPPMVDFGSGLHRCIGEHLAMLEATVMLAQLLRHYDWDLLNGPSSLENQRQDLLIYPVDGMPVRFRPRSL